MSTFETKEQYIKFISAWKSATNAEEAKSKRVVCDHHQYRWDRFTDEERAAMEAKGYKVGRNSFTIPNGGHYKDHGWLNAEHYIFYNIMRGKNPLRGFNPRSERKLTGYGSPWIAYLHGLWALESAVNDAQFYISIVEKGKKPVCGNTARAFLKPFNGEISIGDLAKINKEELANARKFPD